METKNEAVYSAYMLVLNKKTQMLEVQKRKIPVKKESNKK